MNLNRTQKLIILVGVIFIVLSFIVPPCHLNMRGENIPVGYVPFVMLLVQGVSNEVNNNIFIHTPTFYAQLITICLATFGLVIISKDRK